MDAGAEKTKLKTGSGFVFLEDISFPPWQSCIYTNTHFILLCQKFNILIIVLVVGLEGKVAGIPGTQCGRKVRQSFHLGNESTPSQSLSSRQKIMVLFVLIRPQDV
jgi:hypothetical protein